MLQYVFIQLFQFAQLDQDQVNLTTALITNRLINLFLSYLSKWISYTSRVLLINVLWQEGILNVLQGCMVHHQSHGPQQYLSG